MEFLLGAEQIVVKIPESSGGISTESILVFIGGVLAAIAAVAAAIITTKGASSRLQQQLANERERFDKQLAAEASRSREQLDHDRYLARRSEASKTLEQISRLVAQHVVAVYDFFSTISGGKHPTAGAFHELNAQVDQLREEISIIAIRFGNKSPLVTSLASLLGGVSAALPLSKAALGGDDKEEEIQQFLDDLNGLQARFMIEAKKALDEF